MSSLLLSMYLHSLLPKNRTGDPNGLPSRTATPAI